MKRNHFKMQTWQMQGPLLMSTAVRKHGGTWSLSGTSSGTETLGHMVPAHQPALKPFNHPSQLHPGPEPVSPLWLAQVRLRLILLPWSPKQPNHILTQRQPFPDLVTIVFRMIVIKANNGPNPTTAKFAAFFRHSCECQPTTVSLRGQPFSSPLPPSSSAYQQDGLVSPPVQSGLQEPTPRFPANVIL